MDLKVLVVPVLFTADNAFLKEKWVLKKKWMMIQKRLVMITLPALWKNEKFFL